MEIKGTITLYDADRHLIARTERNEQVSIMYDILKLILVHPNKYPRWALYLSGDGIEFSLYRITTSGKLSIERALDSM